MPRLLVLCPYPVGVAAGQRLKYEQYIRDWGAAGFDVEVRPFMDMRLWRSVHQRGRLFAKSLGTARGLFRRIQHVRDLRSFDLVYLFQWASPIGADRMERYVRGRAKRLIYDIEDNVLDPATVRQVRANPLLRWLRGRSKAAYLVAAADHVITSSPELAERCGTMNYRGAATYISSSVDTDRFLPANDYSNDDTVVIGWTGTISSRTYLDMLRPVFARLAQVRSFRLRVIGNFDYALDGVDLEVLRWNAEDEVAQMQGIDIGLYPLVQDEWVGGKSGLKAIQYMAFGIPCVATEAGHTPQVVADGRTGLLVRTEDEWIEALTRLIDDPALRRTIGEAARAEAVERFSLAATAGRYRAVIEDVMRLPASGKRM